MRGGQTKGAVIAEAKCFWSNSILSPMCRNSAQDHRCHINIAQDWQCDIDIVQDCQCDIDNTQDCRCQCHIANLNPCTVFIIVTVQVRKLYWKFHCNFCSKDAGLYFLCFLLKKQFPGLKLWPDMFLPGAYGAFCGVCAMDVWWSVLDAIYLVATNVSMSLDVCCQVYAGEV
jgi:hypothetical protein